MESGKTHYLMVVPLEVAVSDDDIQYHTPPVTRWWVYEYGGGV